VQAIGANTFNLKVLNLNFIIHLIIIFSNGHFISRHNIESLVSLERRKGSAWGWALEADAITACKAIRLTRAEYRHGG
jgi:hypothetical protein